MEGAILNFAKEFNVIVIGGGHAGTEAALASARMGCSTLLLTHNIDTLGQMSCNPAIGGIGKSHLVKEVDAFDGIMAKATDHAGIQFRTLNSRKGPAVRATRAQADRILYRAYVRHALENQPNLTLFQQAVTDLIVEGDVVKGAVTQMGLKFHAQRVILTSGTFLGGILHIGLQSQQGGRAGDPASVALAQRLRELPLRTGRLKTGTPPRIDARSVDFSELGKQWGDTKTPVMSYMGSAEDHPEQVCCHITHTNSETHDIIRGGLDRSPLYSGEIEGVGPRYCPSIEDKVMRFADKDSHQIFIEPEGLTTHELYPNGISTSLPFDVQINLVRSMKGFENAHITRPGYAIEYDFFNPQDLKPTLESKFLSGLYFAGQINGTTGYEEAAAQGTLAGINAAAHVKGMDPLTLRRDESYTGVLVDDLITLGTKEPYRMFTSRAEYRLLLREDNADSRLTEIGRKYGVVSDERWERFSRKMEAVATETERLKTTWVHPNTEQATQLEALGEPIAREANLLDLLKRPKLTYSDIAGLKGVASDDSQVAEQVQITAKYEGYIARQTDEIEKLKRSELIAIPEFYDYSEISGLSNELVSKLEEVRPSTLGQASRIPGVTPAAISLLLIHIKKGGQKRA